MLRRRGIREIALSNTRRYDSYGLQILLRDFFYGFRLSVLKPELPESPGLEVPNKFIVVRSTMKVKKFESETDFREEQQMFQSTSRKRLVTWALLAIFAITNSGCTKEKAEAIKSGAEQFSLEAKTALDKTRDLVKASISMPAEANEDEVRRIVRNFEHPAGGVKRDDANVSQFALDVLGSGNESAAANQMIDQEFQNLEAEYELFASMFRSLPRGHFFAKDAVAKSERHSIRLTARFVKQADLLQRIPVQFTGRRTDLVIKLLVARDVGDPAARAQAETQVAQQLIQLREDERKAKDSAIIQCLKAAESGKTVTELIHNYSKFTVADMLDLIKDSLNILNSITGGTNQDVKGLVTRYNSFVANKIKTDSLWNDVLTNDLHWSPGQ